MPQDHSFDIVSKPNLQELDNAITMSLKEIGQRFDFKDSHTEITHEADKIVVKSIDDYKVKTAVGILQDKLIKRGVSLKFLEPGVIEQALGGTAKQDLKIKQGIAQEQAKDINKRIKDMGVKVQSQIQGDQLRVSAKKIDDLQLVMQNLKKANLPIELQFTNYR